MVSHCDFNLCLLNNQRCVSVFSCAYCFHISFAEHHFTFVVYICNLNFCMQVCLWCMYVCVCVLVSLYVCGG